MARGVTAPACAFSTLKSITFSVGRVKMKTILRKILVPVGVIWFIGLLIAGFMAYLVNSVGPGGLYDGLGRRLTEAPVLMRIFFGQERMWAGWFWFAVDMLVFWGSVALALILGKWLEKSGD